MKKKFWLFGSLLLFLAAILGLSFWANVGTRENPAAADDSTADAGFTPVPTLPMPAALTHSLARFIIQAVNTSLSQSEETSLEPMRRRSGPALIELKQALAKMIAAKLKNENLEWKSWMECRGLIEKEAQNSMEEAAKAFAGMTRKTGSNYFYEPFKVKDIHCEPVDGHPELLAVETKVLVNCGADESFYLFQMKGKGYELILKQEDDDPKSTGQEGFKWAVAPPDEKGDYFAAWAYGRPWCTSCWGGLNYAVLKMGGGGEPPRVLLAKKDYIYRCGGISLKVGKDDFLLSFTGSQGLDTGVLVRKCIRHYRIQGKEAQLIAPLGDFPEDFLDEWIKTSWDEAKGFCGEQDRAALKNWHEKLKASKGISGLEFVQPCPLEAHRWEIGLQPGDPQLPSSLYFEISQKEGDFRLEDIRKTRLGNCPGTAAPTPHPVDMG